MDKLKRQKIVVVGAGPVGSLAALYAATRGDDVEIYELRGGKQETVHFCGFSIDNSILLHLQHMECLKSYTFHIQLLQSRVFRMPSFAPESRSRRKVP